MNTNNNIILIQITLFILILIRTVLARGEKAGEDSEGNPSQNNSPISGQQQVRQQNLGALVAARQARFGRRVGLLRHAQQPQKPPAELALGSVVEVTLAKGDLKAELVARMSQQFQECYTLGSLRRRLKAMTRDLLLTGLSFQKET